jgi:hypothetical protein
MRNTMTQAAAGKWISKRQARDLFRAAKLNEQQLYPVAERHYDEHGTWPGDYLQAKHATARAFGVFIDAGIFSGITVAAVKAA